MRTGCLIFVMLWTATIANAAAPTTKPATRPAGMSIQEAEIAMGLMGPVQTANYTRTFAPPKGDPHQQYRDRFMYGSPSYSPYSFYGGCYPYFGCYGGYGCGGGSGVFTPSGIFYGD